MKEKGKIVTELKMLFKKRFVIIEIIEKDNTE